MEDKRIENVAEELEVEHSKTIVSKRKNGKIIGYFGEEPIFEFVEVDGLKYQFEGTFVKSNPDDYSKMGIFFLNMKDGDTIKFFESNGVVYFA